MLKRILLFLGLLIVVSVVVVALQPTDFRVTRSATISAPPHAVFAQVNNFHHWQAWSPWADRDRHAKTTFEGPEAGTGATFTWSGNAEVGEGRMTIVESQPDERIRIKLEFTRPFEATNDVTFAFQPQEDQTVVTWNMEGKRNFLGKAICMFMNMDKMVGGDFEQGLAKMKKVTETPPEPTNLDDPGHE